MKAKLRKFQYVPLFLITPLLLLSGSCAPALQPASLPNHNRLQLGIISDAKTLPIAITNPNPYPIEVAFHPPSGCACVSAEPTTMIVAARSTGTVHLTIEPDSNGEHTKAFLMETSGQREKKETWIYATYVKIPSH